MHYVEEQKGNGINFGTFKLFVTLTLLQNMRV